MQPQALSNSPLQDAHERGRGHGRGIPTPQPRERSLTARSVPAVPDAAAPPPPPAVPHRPPPLGPAFVPQHAKRPSAAIKTGRPRASIPVSVREDDAPWPSDPETSPAPTLSEFPFPPALPARPRLKALVTQGLEGDAALPKSSPVMMETESPLPMSAHAPTAHARTPSSAQAPAPPPPTVHARTHSTAHAQTPPTAHARTPSSTQARTPPVAHARTPSSAHARTPSSAHARTPPIAHARTPSTAHARMPSSAHARTPSAARQRTLSTPEEAPAPAPAPAPATPPPPKSTTLSALFESSPPAPSPPPPKSTTLSALFESPPSAAPPPPPLEEPRSGSSTPTASSPAPTPAPATASPGSPRVRVRREHLARCAALQHGMLSGDVAERLSMYDDTPLTAFASSTRPFELPAAPPRLTKQKSMPSMARSKRPAPIATCPVSLASRRAANLNLASAPRASTCSSAPAGGEDESIAALMSDWQISGPHTAWEDVPGEYGRRPTMRAVPDTPMDRAFPVVARTSTSSAGSAPETCTDCGFERDGGECILAHPRSYSSYFSVHKTRARSSTALRPPLPLAHAFLNAHARTRSRTLGAADPKPLLLASVEIEKALREDPAEEASTPTYEYSSGEPSPASSEWVRTPDAAGASWRAEMDALRRGLAETMADLGLLREEARRGSEPSRWSVDSGSAVKVRARANTVTATTTAPLHVVKPKSKHKPQRSAPQSATSGSASASASSSEGDEHAHAHRASSRWSEDSMHVKPRHRAPSPPPPPPPVPEKDKEKEKDSKDREKEKEKQSLARRLRLKSLPSRVKAKFSAQDLRAAFVEIQLPPRELQVQVAE